MRTILATLILLLAGGVCETRAQVENGGEGSDSCRVCSSKLAVKCPTCKGTGQERFECPLCEGAGKTDCLSCGPIELGAFKNKKMSSAERRKAEALRKKIQKALRNPGRGTKTKEKKPKKGYTDCPNRTCYGGRMIWDVGKTNPCRVCGTKGLVKCPGCRGGNRRCLVCAGKRKVIGTCRTCRGHGNLSCPGCQLEAPTAKCPLCNGRKTTACGACQKSRHLPNHCGTCRGQGVSNCEDCRGHQRLTCGTCSGSGKVRYKIVTPGGGNGGSGGIRGCEECSGRGYDKCTECRRGKVTCERCHGQKTVPDKCSRRAWCQCAAEGSSAGLELMGDLLLEAGSTARAGEFFIQAKKSLDSSPEPSSKKKKAERTKARSRLDKKIKRAAS